MGRYDAVSDYDYQEERGNPVPRQRHSEKRKPVKPEPKVQPKQATK